MRLSKILDFPYQNQVILVDDGYKVQKSDLSVEQKLHQLSEFNSMVKQSRDYLTLNRNDLMFKSKQYNHNSKALSDKVTLLISYRI